MSKKILILAFVFFSRAVSGQEYIGGVINDYFSVTDTVNSNTVICDDATGLSVGDKVLMIQMKGAQIDLGYVHGPSNVALLDLNNNSAGKYEFLSVLAVNTSTNQVTFTQDFINKYQPDEKIQLVKAYVGYNTVISSPVIAEDWNGETGGVVAMIILGKLTFNSDIDLSAQGFRGGQPLEYTETCRPIYSPDTMYFKNTYVNRGGMKGEGISSDTSTLTIGAGHNFNGGGGGSGRFGGGGGGSNNDAGGVGGTQRDGCSSSTLIPNCGYGLQTGGFQIFSWTGLFYTDFKRLTMGGGGGGSTYEGALTSTPGSSGGGLVIVMADSIIGNSRSINVSGGDVAGLATAGAGGGGAGGTVVIDAPYFSTDININARGGDGGSVDETLGCGGAGGSGAGGYILSSDFPLNSNINTILAGGTSGSGGCDTLGLSNNGFSGAVLGQDYVINLNGFTFNAIYPIDTICTGQDPELLVGTIPKGASNPAFKWLSKSNLSDPWVEIPGADTRDYQPPTLFDTMYYTREVYFSGPDIRDTAKMVTVVVLPDITDNTLTLRDTVCFGLAPSLSANSPGGGDGSYLFSWESSEDLSVWTNRTNKTADEILAEDPLNTTTYYRRTVFSGPKNVCSSISNVDTISVLNSITNNNIINPSLDTLICQGLPIGLNLGSQPSGGEPGNYSYQWMSSTDDISYSDIGGATGVNYQPAGLAAATTYLRRVVLSGEGNACKDTSTTRRLLDVLSPITNNIITTDSSRYCSGDTPTPIGQDVSQPIGGGDAPNFSYQWQVRAGSNWLDIAGAASASYSPTALSDSMEYRRIALSGEVVSGLFACADSSTPLTINVIPVIINTLVSSDETICQSGQPLAFNEADATGGANEYEYIWEQNTDGAGWESASGTNTQASYNPPVLYEPTDFRRKVISQICSASSNEISITVLDSIVSNTILGATEQYNCYNSLASLNGSVPGGGAGTPSYNWEESSDGISWSATGSVGQDLEGNPILSETYFRRIVLSGPNGECLDTSNTVLTRINDLPTGDILSGMDTLCAGDEITISYSGLTGASPWTIEIGGDEVIHSESGITNTSGTFTAVISETAALSAINIIDDSLCYANPDLTTGIVEATVYEVPVASAGDDEAVCSNQYTLNATLSTPGEGYWQSVEGSFDNANLPNATISMESYGEKELIWTETNWQCTDQDEVLVTFYEQPTEVNAGEDQELPYTFITQLEGNQPLAPSSGYWSFVTGSGTFDDDDSTKRDATIEMPSIGDYELSWTIVNGACEPISDNMSIKIADLVLDNGFSPNADGLNDEYVILIPSGNAVKLTILSRTGGLIMELSGELEIRWDGTNESGQQVPEDTYFYIIEEEGAPVRKGFIELRR